MKTENLTFEEAMQFLRDGKRISRKGCEWTMCIQIHHYETRRVNLFIDDLLATDWETRECGTSVI
jgi:hypothetical protein